jgi:long-chain acyl-CoA synthetase
MSETINTLFAESVATFGERPALAVNSGEGYRSVTYAELAEQVRDFASGLAALGVGAGDRIAVVSENRPEWIVADLAMLALGAVNVPMFPTLPPAQIEYIVRDAGARLMVVSNAAQLQKARAVQAAVPDLKIIIMDEPSDPAHEVTCFTDVMAQGTTQPLSPEEFIARRDAVRPDDLASIIYTSGTTGEPKGVMLTHRNFASNVVAALEPLTFAPDDVFVSFLPLNHCLERTAGYYAPLASGSLIAFAQSLRRLRDNIREVEPTYLILVPRLYEGLHAAIEEKIAKSSPLKRKLFAWAQRVGRARMTARLAGRGLSPLLAVQWALARRLVHDKVRAAAGLRRLKFLVSGGAPLADETAIFFHSTGMPLLEGYGLTETSPVISFNNPEAWKLGSVGLPVPGVEVRIAANGEILCRGPNIMRGYYNKPEETAAVLDEDGWLHTGDLGEIDADGFLRITGRLKDLIVLSNGKKVAPQGVESELMRSPFIAQAVVVGDGRSTVGALLVPSFQRVRVWAGKQGLALPEDDTGLAASDAVVKLLRAEVERVSDRLADYEKPRGVALLDHELTVENGELTPTLKVKRNVVLERYAELVERICPRG